jgi:hypothetical protein
LGIRQTHIVSQKWRPEDQELEPKQRPGRAEAMRAAHAALSHLDWLREKLEMSADDTRPRVPHEKMMNDAQAIIDRKCLALAEKKRIEWSAQANADLQPHNTD